MDKSLWKDPQWQKRRLKILERDEWSCKVCNRKDRTLHVHHIFYEPDIENPWEYSDNLLITLCDECHADAHDRPIYMPWHMNAIINIGLFNIETMFDHWDRFVDMEVPMSKIVDSWGPLI